MVSLRWFGQACFEISGSITVVTDPHDGGGVGLKPPQTKGDVVTISHGHFDHADGVNLVRKEDTKVVGEEGITEAKGIVFEGIKTFHDKSQGSERGENLVFKFELDGFKICHLGDLGHKLGNTAEKIKPVDILLIPVGGKFTIDGKEAKEVVEELQPRVVIPMHYKIRGLKVPISGPDDFLEGEEVVAEDELVLEKLPEEREIVKLNPQA